MTWSLSLCSENWKKEKTIKSIFFNGRHYNILFILTMQYPLGITPELRSNIDYVFITHHHLDHSSNMGMFPRAKIFIGDGYITRFKPNYDVYKKLELISLPENFKIIPTPGHTLESNSYLYVENGTRYICAGDAVREDVIREGAPTVQNDKKQYLESLKKVFSLGDVIIPGHGRMIEGELKKELEKLIYS